MELEQDWLDQMAEERAADDPEFAALNLRADFMLQLVPLRKELGLTQEDMAERLGIARPQIAVMEVRPQKASLDRIAAYARALGARLDLVLPAVAKTSLASKPANVGRNGRAVVINKTAGGKIASEKVLITREISGKLSSSSAKAKRPTNPAKK